MNSMLSNSRENILNDDSFQQMSFTQSSLSNNRIKSAVSNRISSAVSNTREASNKLNVQNTAQYPVAVPKEVSHDDFTDSRGVTFISDSTVQENLTEDAIIEDLANLDANYSSETSSKRPKTAQFLAPAKQSRNLSTKLDKLPTDNQSKVLPFRALPEIEVKTNAKFNKIPPIKPIADNNGTKKYDNPKTPTELTISMDELFQAENSDTDQKAFKKVEKERSFINYNRDRFKAKNQKQNDLKTKEVSNKKAKEEEEEAKTKNKTAQPVKEKDNDFIEVRKENPNQKKFFWLSLLAIIIILAILLAIILAVVLGSRSGSIAQMYLQLNTTIILNTTITSTSTSSTTSSTTSTTSTTTTTTAKWCEYTTTPTQTQIISNSFTCPTSSPYVPSFLTLKNWYSYGYLINQEIVCSGSIVNLVCPTNQYIHIYSAYFGIQSQTLSSCTPLTATSPSNCFNKAVFNTINSTCEYNNNCSIVATVSQLGEPCSGNSKQLMIQYQCTDYKTVQTLNQCPVNTNTSTACTDQSDPTVQTQSWCEPSLMKIQCTSPNVIQIVCAYYGIDSSYQCAGGNYIGAPTSCYSTSAKQLVITKCNGKTLCQILGNPNYQTSGFSDPCYGFGKLLYVQYKCVDPATLVTTVTSTNPSTTTTLPFCHNNFIPSGSCNSTASSFYTPSFIKANQTSFNYPIMQRVVCLGSSISLVCPVDTVIHIYSAYFGIQSETSVPACFLTTSEQPAMCYFTNSFSYINTTCEYQKTCLIAADSNILGDPCPYFIQKQLFIQYQCIDQYALSTTINQCSSSLNAPLICPYLNTSSNLTNSTSEQTWCDGAKMNITCKNNQTITIICAFYGLHPSLGSSCNISSLVSPIPVCYFKSSFTFVKTSCSGKNNCSISDLSSNFADPCDGQAKALYAQWKCS